MGEARDSRTEKGKDETSGLPESTFLSKKCTDFGGGGVILLFLLWSQPETSIILKIVSSLGRTWGRR